MGQKLHSKRQRKQKANASLKRKQFDRQDEEVKDVFPPPQRYALGRLSTRYRVRVRRLTASPCSQG